eukprot:2372619-Rhodomonas_salina.1
MSDAAHRGGGGAVKCTEEEKKRCNAQGGEGAMREGRGRSEPGSGRGEQRRAGRRDGGEESGFKAVGGSGKRGACSVGEVQSWEGGCREKRMRREV